MIEVTPEFVIGAILGSNGLFAVVQTLINRHDRKKSSIEEDIEEVKNTIKQMKATDAIVMYSVFSDKIERVLDKGYADPDDRRDIENMYERYKANGWNGDMEARVQKVYALPTKRIEKGEANEQ